MLFLWYVAGYKKQDSESIPKIGCTPEGIKICPWTQNSVGWRKMDIKTTFRNLVTNKYMQNYSYANNTFSFKTLFHQTSYSYFCCACGFEHEYIDYISESGVINEDMYQNILQCILDGKCPHVDNAPSDTYFREAKVYALHVAAAVGTISALKDIPIPRETCPEIKGGIYCLDPLQIAVLKNQCIFVKQIREHLKRQILQEKRFRRELAQCGLDFAGLPQCVRKLSYAARSCQSEYSINFEKINFPTFCIRTSNLLLLRDLLDPVTFFHSNVYEDLELAYDKNVKDMQEELLAYIRVLRHEHIDTLTWCAIAAIVHEQDHALQDILDSINSCRNPHINKLTRQLPTICDIFGKHNQKAIVESFAYCFGPAGMNYKMCVLHYLIKHYTNDYKKELKDASEKLYQSQDAANDENIKSGRFSLVHYFLDSSNPDVDPHYAEVLIKLGANVDAVRTFRGRCRNYQITAMEALLQKSSTKNIRSFRRVLALFMLENPNLEVDTTAVDNGINLDENLHKN